MVLFFPFQYIPKLITTVSLPILTDGDIILEPLNKKLFPGVSRSIEVHSGFAGTQSRFVFQGLS